MGAPAGRPGRGRGRGGSRGARSLRAGSRLRPCVPGVRRAPGAHLRLSGRRGLAVPGRRGPAAVRADGLRGVLPAADRGAGGVHRRQSRARRADPRPVRRRPLGGAPRAGRGVDEPGGLPPALRRAGRDTTGAQPGLRPARGLLPARAEPRSAADAGVPPARVPLRRGRGRRAGAPRRRRCPDARPAARPRPGRGLPGRQRPVLRPGGPGARAQPAVRRRQVRTDLPGVRCRPAPWPAAPTFGESITGPDGEPAHSSCVGLGMERVVLALFAGHGMATADWPDAVRSRLWPGPGERA